MERARLIATFVVKDGVPVFSDLTIAGAKPDNNFAVDDILQMEVVDALGSSWENAVDNLMVCIECSPHLEWCRPLMDL